MKERELFLAALEIADPAARRAHVKTECGEDVALLARVESLLTSHEGESRFLNTPVAEQIADDSDGETAATIFSASGSTQDDEQDRTALFSEGESRMQERRDDADEAIALGYLEPSAKPGSLGRLSHYEVLEVIGRGAFGIVLRAFDEKLQRVVAIKVMSPEMASTSPARNRFLREARASAAIRHENVVSVYAVEEKPLPYLVMEYIPGLTLQQRLDEGGPLEVPTVLRLGRQIAEGLAAAHSQELIHRDIKPGNILLDAGVLDKVKITDFGLARAADDASLTRSGVIAGTPMYMAPEQAWGHKLDQRADLFSLGSVLYQMVSGRPPFRASGTLAVLKRVVEDTPRPIRESVPETPQWLCDIIAKLHAKNPEQRFRSAREVADVLADCEVQLKENAKLQDFARIPSFQSAPSAKWKPLMAGGVVGTLLLLGAILVLFTHKEGTENSSEMPDGQDVQVDALKSGRAGDATSSSVATTAEVKRRFASDEWIDVIPLVDPRADKWDVRRRTGKNAWRIEGTELHSDGDPLASKLILPLDSDWPAFECELEFTRRVGDSGFNVNLPTKVGECPLVIDYPGAGGGLHLGARGKGMLMATVAQIVTGRRTTLRIEVRRRQDSDQVVIAVDDVKVGEWTGDRNAISNTYKEGFPNDRRVSLWINPGGNEFTFHRIRVRILDGGSAESLRTVLRPSPPGLPLINVRFDNYDQGERTRAYVKHSPR